VASYLYWYNKNIWKIIMCIKFFVIIIFPQRKKHHLLKHHLLKENESFLIKSYAILKNYKSVPKSKNLQFAKIWKYIMGLNTWCSDNKSILLLVLLLKKSLFCVVYCAQRIHNTRFKFTQGNMHLAKIDTFLTVALIYKLLNLTLWSLHQVFKSSVMNFVYCLNHFAKSHDRLVATFDWVIF